MVDYDRDYASEIRSLVAPDDVWTLSESIKKTLLQMLRKLPKKNVSDEERRYPTTPEGLRAFIDGFFARHYFQIQDSLINYFSSSAFMSNIQRGELHIADIGSGPGVASLAIADLAATTMRVMNGKGLIPRGKTISVNCVINDTSAICLNEGLIQLKKFNSVGSEQIRISRVLTLSSPYPKSINQFRRIAQMTTPYDICCMGYVLIPLTEQFDVSRISDTIIALSQTGNTDGGQLIIIQDHFREKLHRKVCRKIGVKSETIELKQHVYDSENQNTEHTYTYCRSCPTFSELNTVNKVDQIA